MSNTPTAVVGFCHPQAGVTPQFRQCLAGVEMHCALTRDVVLLGESDHEVSGVHIPDARCRMVENFLAHPNKPDFLWICDTDATFADDVLINMISVADPVERPIVGALSFVVVPRCEENGTPIFNSVLACEYDLFPTVYVENEHGQTGIGFDYPADALVPVYSTGCHCFVVHRSVLADPRWREDGHPLPFFRIAVVDGKVQSEDQFFFLKARSFGYQTYVHTGIKTGHVKTFVADEEMFLRQKEENSMVKSMTPRLS